MPFRLFDAPEREPSHFVGFAGNIIDRQAENRSDDALEAAIANPATRLILTRGGRLYLKLNGDAFDPYFDHASAVSLGAVIERGVLLGMSAAGPVVVAPSGLDPEALPEGVKAIDHRSVYVQDLVGEETLGEIAQGAALLAWHSSHRFCGRCGTATEPRIGGYKRVCPSCNAEFFPRTDPVAIMLAVTRDRCLMGRSPHFQPGMYSALAGFIEPGETIENAVRREILEESGIRVGRVVYHASQPWPFPHSLMIGCYGEALNEDIVFDGNELEDCRWFTREETRAVLAGTHGSVACPPKAAIAHHLIRAWAESE